MQDLGDEQRELVRPLPNDVYNLLVQDLDGMCANLMPEEALALGMSNDALHELAIDNLTALARAGTFQFSLPIGPRGLPFVVTEGHWPSATCLLLRGLFANASRMLESESLLASIPALESLVIFRDADRAYRSEMREMIARAEEGQSKPITPLFFKLGPDDPLSPED